MTNQQEGASKNWFLKHKIISAVLVLFILGIVGSLGDNKQSEQQVVKPEINNFTNTNADDKPQEKTADNKEQEQAVKDLQFFMEKFAKEGLVDSYKLSSDNKVYVTSVWYGMTVQSKKDFLNMAMDLKKKATGYDNLEIRHFQSNELLADTWGVKK